MRLYHALLVTAVALLASNVSAGAVDCAMTPGEIVESASGSAPRDSFDGFDSSNDSPVQQGSTTSSDVGASQEVSFPSGSSPSGSSPSGSSPSGSSPKDSFDGFDSSNDSPIQQGSTTSSDVGASQGSAPDSPIQQGSAPTDASFISSYSGPTPDFPDYGASQQGSATDAPVNQGSDVGASQGSSPDSPVQQGSDVGASQGSSPDSPVQQGSDVGASQGSSPDSPIQQGSTAASGSQGSQTDAPVTQDSTTASGVDASQASTSASASASGPDDIKQGIVIPAGTDAPASLPPYSSGKTGPDVYMIWWYAHHGRIAFDGKNWAAYFGAAISTSEGGCINIHQGDRMKVVDASGKITADEDSFDWGCSHSGYERITYDNRTDSYATICKTDSNNRIMPPKDWDTTIYPVDLAASNLGDIVPDSVASSKKYWATVSNGNGDNAKVHLIHFAMNAAASEDITLGGTDANERAPHLASIGSGGMLAMWEGSSSGGDLAEGGARTIYAQVLDASTGKAISDKVTVEKSVVGNRYQALKTYPDGSVAYLSKGRFWTRRRARPSATR
ncbi:hypothetical protein PHYPSEUDO_001016 [Phytophthora pseudosyringae]|uniref:Uncharacterized protein n=1 Tax=Phytophthora pseudosyringae TaxID=221518 RepID=A0A8T1VX09_9STRA|nr:hypothetical protein PHYPSEUDO_001016 [Phytophthora pseudosyringae]